jgi:hypothetical protein
MGNVQELPFSVCYFVLPLDTATRPFLRLAGVRFYLVADEENPVRPTCWPGGCLSAMTAASRCTKTRRLGELQACLDDDAGEDCYRDILDLYIN